MKGIIGHMFMWACGLVTGILMGLSLERDKKIYPVESKMIIKCNSVVSSLESYNHEMITCENQARFKRVISND